MVKTLALLPVLAALAACSPSVVVLKQSPERIIYQYHWKGQVESLTLQAQRYCGRFDKEARLERQDIDSLEYVCE
jgi:ABC-type nitrate/sulfonate/bicarbonate transport system substrate-binding protein